MLVSGGKKKKKKRSSSNINQNIPQSPGKRSSSNPKTPAKLNFLEETLWYLCVVYIH